MIVAAHLKQHRMIKEPNYERPLRWHLVIVVFKQAVFGGGNGIVDGPVDDANYTAVSETIKSKGFGNKEEENARFKSLTQQCFLFLM